MAKSIDRDHWMQRLSHAQDLQSRQHKNWKENHALIEGTWFEKQQFLPDPDATAVNYATAYHKTMVSSIYSRNPYIFVNARHSRFTDFAYSARIVVNHLWKELNIKRQMKRAVADTNTCSLGWIETGYHATFGQMNLDEDKDGLTDSMLDRLVNPKSAEQLGVLNEYVKEQSAYCMRLDPWKVLLAPGYQEISSMPYLFVGEDIAPEDVENHPLYSKHLDGVRPAIPIKQSGQAIKPVMGMFRKGGSSDLMLHRLWHVWDRRNLQRFILVENSDVVIGPFSWPSLLEGFIQTPILFNEIPEIDGQTHPYGQSDFEPMKPLIKELNQLRTAMVRHRKRSGSLILVGNSASEEDIEALRTGDDVAIVRVSEAILDMVKLHSPPQLAPDVYKVNDRILADLDLVSGFSQVMLGGQAGKDTLATELNLQSAGASTRTSEKVDVIEDVSRQVARRLLAVAWQHYPREVIRQILGETILTEAMWPSLPDDPIERREIIQNELLLEIEPGSSTPPKDRVLERKQKLDTVNVLMAVMPDRVKQGTMAKWLLKSFDDQEVQDMFITDDEQEVAHAAAENELLLQDMPQVVGPNELHQVHVQEHQKAIQAAGTTTKAMDEHILQHAQMMQMKAPGASPQAGDTRSPSGAAAPEQLRAGVPKAEDIQGPQTRALTESGTDKGGIRNV